MIKSHSILHAEPGDRLVIRGHHVGEPDRDAEILEVLGDDGTPPYLVRWEDDGRVSRLYPSSDAHIHHFEQPTSFDAADEKKHQERGRTDQALGEDSATTAEWESAVPPRDS